MDIDAQLKLQAFLDGELPEAEAKDVANWLARDQEAALLLGELRHTRQGLAGYETVMQLPESREFYWSKIKREIERLDPVPAAAPKRSLLAAWRRMLVPASAIAGVIIVALLMVGPQGVVTESEAAMEDPGAFTYRDYPAQATLVWLSYPAENEIAEPSSTDTIPQQ
jgi:negative regulator of sigma E activity